MKSKQVTVSVQTVDGPPQAVQAVERAAYPGLAVGPTLAEVRRMWGHRFAVYHVASGLVAAKGTRAHCWRIVEAIGPLTDWTRPVAELDRDAMRAASRECRKHTIQAV